MPDNKGTILVVDDDRLVLATLAHGLSQAGYDVIDADNGDDAILLAREHRPDLALLDIRMQGMSGFDVAAYLRDHLAIPFMFLSAFADDDTAAKVQALGAVAYLVKPLDIGQILPVVGTSMARIRNLAQVQAPAAALAPARPGNRADPLVWIAVGMLMQQAGLRRGAALERLDGLAAAAHQPPADWAQSFIEAFEATPPTSAGNPAGTV